MSTSPERVETVEGFVAVINCIARGNVIGEISWSRDYEALDGDKVSITSLRIALVSIFFQYAYRYERTKASDHEGLKIVFVSVQQNYSGLYTCTVSNQFETVQAQTKFLVWQNSNAHRMRALKFVV